MAAAAAMRVVQAKLADLRPWERNPRKISPARLEQLQRALEAEPDMMHARPLIALPDGTVIAGNQRLAAAQALGWTKIPVVYADLDEHRAAEWALRDNRAYGEDVDERVGELLAELAAAGRDLDLTGYDTGSVDRMLAATRRSDVDPDEVPPLPAKPRSRLGEVYELGEHRLMCGDATDPTSYVALLRGEKARVVFTDPPYGVDYTGGSKPREGLAGDEIGTGVYMAALPLIAECATDDASFYVWYADMSIAAAAAAAAGLRVRCQIMWLKNQAQFFNNARYHGRHEPCIYAAKEKGSAAWFGPTNETTVWEEPRARANDLHPTQKPVALAERALRNSSERGDLVLDPFAGSGSTLIAAEMTGRRCMAMELDPAYCDVIRDRYEQFVAAA